MPSALTLDVQALVDPLVLELKRKQHTGDKDVALKVAHVLMRVISAARWTDPHDLIALIRKVGLDLHHASPREFIPGNVVRRVLAIIRDEIETADPLAQDNTPMISLMFSLLSTAHSVQDTQHPQHKLLKKQLSDMRSIVIQGIRDLIDEISNVKEELENMAADLIHENELLLTATPGSDTVLQFLIKARAKRNFTVLVTESFPNDTEDAHRFVKALAENKIQTVLIPDSTVFAVMPRVGKVILGANTVFANGGCMLNSGVANVVECAKEHKTPVFGVAGLYKLSPLYPFNREDLIEVGNSGKVLSYSNSKLMENVDVVTNPLGDYVPPEHIDIYITNVGGFAPSFIYRIVLDNYKPEDTSLE
ncbi:IF-2B-domain-containing protein [Metschnikowia bicuspidata var. bicuspidata NRRL YB-4993]|uniref:Translation initiation factor eIF2B subunit beta n=1 Tax=Metschnikowia bicuspidata var. bicuspidata NRRL YB-4993 TaxID=869754 RepID=A0A1A0HEV5_9ASCO|nr:IF-2B-domain-containing protein [Metschnikowia bicuspidata var. bicuspidata NRRL YB-4993]OBA22531.1 IF-2B-domain-containing protein [Metschnikowia bicuspidata var. bicuspidata NRRL YB-4993]